MREFGYVEGQNIDIEYRFAEGRLERFPALAEELIRLSPNVIVAFVTPAAVATRALTQTIPIVCPLLADPIHLGLIASDSRPGGNVTGVLFRTEGLAGKQLELALQMIPDVVTIGFVVNVASGVIIDRQELEHACQKLGRLPTIYGFREHVDAGGLVSYGVNLAENFHRAAAYVNKILKGANPGDLPVEFPTELELVINERAAKALGLIIPQSVLVRADEVIE